MTPVAMAAKFETAGRVLTLQQTKHCRQRKCILG